METTATSDASASKPGNGKRWLKRLGKVAFWLFFLKGIGWLVLAALVYFGLVEDSTEEAAPAATIEAIE